MSDFQGPRVGNESTTHLLDVSAETKDTSKYVYYARFPTTNVVHVRGRGGFPPRGYTTRRETGRGGRGRARVAEAVSVAWRRRNRSRVCVMQCVPHRVSTVRRRQRAEGKTRTSHVRIGLAEDFPVISATRNALVSNGSRGHVRFRRRDSYSARYPRTCFGRYRETAGSNRNRETTFSNGVPCAAVARTSNPLGTQRGRYRPPVGGERVLGGKVLVNVSLKEVICASDSQALYLT